MHLFADSMLQPDNEVQATSMWPKMIRLSKDSRGQTAGMVPMRTGVESKELYVHSNSSSGL